jgi:glycyl-tRNA synthetase beta chain
MSRRQSVGRSRLTTHSRFELLVEIGTEELPAHFIAPALTELKERAAQLLNEARLVHESITTLGTPRRLTLAVQSLAERQEFLATEVMGPPKSVAFDSQGRPTQAALRFAESQGVDPAALEVRSTRKGDYVLAVKRHAGEKTTALLPDLLTRLIGGIAFPKAMRWNETQVRFARPVRWLLGFYGEKPLRFTFAGVTSGQTTIGHRFLGPNKAIRVKDFKSYMNNLEKAGVMVDQERRRSSIVSQLERIAKQKHAVLLRDEALLEEAVFSVEMPHAIVGQYSPEYLALPREVLITAMKEHQGFFTLLDTERKLMPYFAAVSNMAARQAPVIRIGNERVLAARLADAKFFFEEDRKTPLPDRCNQLKGIIFHQDLGTMHDKLERLKNLVSITASLAGAPQDVIKICKRAAELCKADLTTGMVREFPSLQGIMGAIYARNDGEPEDACNAIAEHYLPRFAEDRIPASLEGQLLSVADRLDTLASFFSAGLIPSGSQDPYALRRHASAVIRILVEGRLSLKLMKVILQAFTILKVPVEKSPVEELGTFLMERFRYYCVASGKVREDIVDAVLKRWQDEEADPRDLWTRAGILQEFSSRPEFKSLVIAYKRAENIAKKSKQTSADPGLFKENAEKELYDAFQAVERQVGGFIQHGEYRETLSALVSLKGPIDRFFETVMVMAEDQTLRNNRLALLLGVRDLFLRYADFSKIQVEAA